MTDLEQALARTLRERGRPVPSRTDPLPSIRARARAQRRHGALAAAVVVLLAAAVVAVPASVARLHRALPTATGSDDGLLDWAARGDLAGDTDLVRAAERAWRSSTTSRRIDTVRVLYAGRVGSARVVLLQARTSDGPALAQLTDRDGTLRPVAAGLLPRPAPAVLRLVDPDPQPYRVLLLARPDAWAVELPELADGGGPGVYSERGADGLVVFDKVFDGSPHLAVALDERDRPLDSSLLPPVRALSAARGQVTVVPPTWDPDRASRLVGATVPDGLLLAARLGGPVEVAQLGESGAGSVVSGAVAAFPRYYEVHRAGTRYLASVVSVRDRTYCLRVQPYAGAGPDAVVLRCALPEFRRGVLGVLTRTGVRSGRLTVGGVTRPLDLGWEPYLEVTGPDIADGPGRLTLTGPRGPLPPVELPG